MIIALVGNPNSGKTTLFNALTGANQFVGNWPGVTVEKKEGSLKRHKEVTVTDLPGIYSLSPYTPEELVSRTYLLDSPVDVILNIVDGSNLERNLYLSTQLMELGRPVVLAINMMDLIEKNGDKLDLAALSQAFGCPVVPISALRGQGIAEAAHAAMEAATAPPPLLVAKFPKPVEEALAEITTLCLPTTPISRQRWYAIKLFERDEKILATQKLTSIQSTQLEACIVKAEAALDDDGESLVTSGRYAHIAKQLQGAYQKKNLGGFTLSDKIDRVVTNRFLAIPLFVLVMFLVYFFSVTTVGAWATDWANDGVFGDGFHLFGIGNAAFTTAAEAGPASFGVWVPGIPVLVESGLTAIHCADWLKELILDGIIGGVGAVLGFVPQLLVLFLCLAFLEACGYMARIAFIMDRIFRRFGLSGKSFIPMLIGTGCSIPGIMASRTIENEPDRRMTITTTSFMPCGAKLPIIALIAGALFGGAWWVATSAYFIGIAAILVSGILLKKTRRFAGETSPFVMELPAYHLPTLGALLRSMAERALSFIKKAGTVILLSSVVLWFLMRYGFTPTGFGMVENLNHSLLAAVGSAIAWIFVPLGFGNWESAVATVTGLIAKENVVGTFGVLLGGFSQVSEDGVEIWTNLQNLFTPLAAYSFLVFNLLCAPCFAAIGAIRREMNHTGWTVFAVGYQCGFAYGVALMVYQLGLLFTGQGNLLGSATALTLLALTLFLLFRPASKDTLKGRLQHA